MSDSPETVPNPRDSEAVKALLWCIAGLERDAPISELTQQEHLSLARAAVMGWLGDLMLRLPDNASHPTGWEPRHIDGAWRVGMRGNLDTRHDATLTVNTHTTEAVAQEIAEWAAETFNAMNSMLGVWINATSVPVCSKGSEPKDFFARPGEVERVEKMMETQGLSFSALVRQALRLYDVHLARLEAGETMTWSGDAKRQAEFAGTQAEEPVPEGMAVVYELAQRLHKVQSPFKSWNSVSGSERLRYVALAREALKAVPGRRLSDDAELVRQSYLDGASAMAETVKSLKVHVTLGPKATFEHGMTTMQDAVNGVVENALESFRGRKDPL